MPNSKFQDGEADVENPASCRVTAGCKLLPLSLARVRLTRKYERVADVECRMTVEQSLQTSLLVAVHPEHSPRISSPSFLAVHHVTMVDRTGRFGRGLAYSAASPWHRLNVPISKMGGSDDDDPDGFGIWAPEPRIR